MIRSLAQALAVGKGVSRRARLLAVASLLVMPLVSLGGVATASAAQAAPSSPSADWWNWAAGLTPTDPTCGVTGQGPLFFVSEFASVSCTVAPGQQVLAAVINFEWSRTEARTPALNSFFPAFCQNPAQPALLACVAWQAGHVTATSATLDGRPLPVVQLTAPVFTENWVKDNVFGVPAGRTGAAAVGYYVQLPPLAPGSYTLVVSGTASNFPSPQGPGDVTVGATIQLNQE